MKDFGRRTWDLDIHTHKAANTEGKRLLHAGKLVAPGAASNGKYAITSNCVRRQAMRCDCKLSLPSSLFSLLSPLSSLSLSLFLFLFISLFLFLLLSSPLSGCRQPQHGCAANGEGMGARKGVNDMQREGRGAEGGGGARANEERLDGTTRILTTA